MKSDLEKVTVFSFLVLVALMALTMITNAVIHHFFWVAYGIQF